MLTKEVILDRIEILANGIIQLRFKKQVVEDGNALSFEYHRTSLEPGVPLANQMEAVNNHLAAMGWPAVSPRDIARIQAHVAVAHTPDVVAAFAAARDRGAP